jgi:nitrate reductase delta subunit
MEKEELLLAIARLLDYPSEETKKLAELLPVEEIESEPLKETLENFLRYYRNRDLTELQKEYVKTFDFSKTTNLYLTYHRLGDKRERGSLLAELKGIYQKRGWEICSNELPDYLPLLLEFTFKNLEEGLKLLSSYKREIEKITNALEEINSPYKELLKALSYLLEELNLQKPKVGGF